MCLDVEQFLRISISQSRMSTININLKAFAQQLIVTVFEVSPTSINTLVQCFSYSCPSAIVRVYSTFSCVWSFELRSIAYSAGLPSGTSDLAICKSPNNV